ncbi:peptidoglycan DD-metalloendopeptidase family protein [Nitrogeniibacter mangrovi]|uniref:Peptidoglycan DD-metalloendopeptidase family protein n=1 Tax=Nitrogeniibacter mangrovi TaxID=2016596 RepID=A0A6C1B5M8_9RHOO|nr:peptidoglycan DD-metalloendopeptidase family protein [Nitrogeniibacter mangrovi]QID18105.1 peptidoglycan DD-metalloendopeptidase family protein [Nitrogeniibacter mangrovi]
MKGIRKFSSVALMALSLGACTTTMNAPVSDRTLEPETPPAVTGAGAQVAAPSPKYYVVEPGDTLNRIAQKFGHTWQEVAEWNDMTDPDQLAVGQTIKVSPPPGAPVSGVTVSPITTGGPSIASTPTAGSAPAPAPVPAGAKTPETGAAPPLKQGPLAKVEPYSDPAWAAANKTPEPEAKPAPAAPESTPAPKVDLSAAWIWPTDGKVLSGFTEGKTKGIDIAGKPGDDVRASAGGRVVYAGAGLRGYGKLVIIKHDADFLSAYAHNRTLLVKEGQAVTKGQKIAELGSTDADRPKLHFEIRRRGKPVDPLKFLPNR